MYLINSSAHKRCKIIRFLMASCSGWSKTLKSYMSVWFDNVTGNYFFDISSSTTPWTYLHYNCMLVVSSNLHKIYTVLQNQQFSGISFLGIRFTATNRLLREIFMKINPTCDEWFNPFMAIFSFSWCFLLMKEECFALSRIFMCFRISWLGYECW